MLIMSKQSKKTLISLKKAQTLINTIIKMIEEKEYCIDVMQQNLAAMGLLKSAHQSLLENHLNTCFKKVMSAKNEKMKQKMVKEVIDVTRISNK